jgi:HAMP domain-containing protein
MTEAETIANAVNEMLRQMAVNRDRIEQLEAALDDMAQYVSRADWHYLKTETRAALEGEKKDG